MARCPPPFLAGNIAGTLCSRFPNSSLAAPKPGRRGNPQRRRERSRGACLCSAALQGGFPPISYRRPALTKEGHLASVLSFPVGALFAAPCSPKDRAAVAPRLSSRGVLDEGPAFPSSPISYRRHLGGLRLWLGSLDPRHVLACRSAVGAPAVSPGRQPWLRGIRNSPAP